MVSAGEMSQPCLLCPHLPVAAQGTRSRSQHSPTALLGHPRSRKLKLSSFPVASQRAAAGPRSQASPRTPVPSPAPGSSPGHLQRKRLTLEQHRNSSCQKAISGCLSCRQLTHPACPAGSCTERKTKPRLIQSSKTESPAGLGWKGP